MSELWRIFLELALLASLLFGCCFNASIVNSILENSFKSKSNGMGLSMKYMGISIPSGDLDDVATTLISWLGTNNTNKEIAIKWDHESESLQFHHSYVCILFSIMKACYWQNNLFEIGFLLTSSIQNWNLESEWMPLCNALKCSMGLWDLLTVNMWINNHKMVVSCQDLMHYMPSTSLQCQID